MHRGHCEVIIDHLFGQPIYLLLGVTEDHSLGDCEVVVEIAEGLELPLLFVNRDEVLLDALEGEFVSFDEDFDGVLHEFGGNVQDLLGESGTHDH